MPVQMGLYGLEIANATSAFGLQYHIGHASSVGIAGFTLGGGQGFGGLAIDQACLLTRMHAGSMMLNIRNFLPCL